ncbi:hypothetical protein NP233_g5071 [Leucocoprinus birnbaumii]|uniref:WD40 repeat-like protein n=1 Tax=Leucocoprinus birnbaumii TaxID=56174 RepID=A0AAD5VTZ8_9AGAR|nr:hypothetical protein NP233_g5071 [Leucocoprinus birnbaumii]
MANQFVAKCPLPLTMRSKPPISAQCSALLWRARNAEGSLDKIMINLITYSNDCRLRSVIVAGFPRNNSFCYLSSKPWGCRMGSEAQEDTTKARWSESNVSRHITFPAHGSSVVTCMLLSRNRIITASDDHTMNVYSPFTGELIHSLEGHEGGIWTIDTFQDTLVSGSTDCTVRIWNLESGRCTHVFGGHTSTVRCLSIVKPETVGIPSTTGKMRSPKRPLIVSGSRDHTLRVWKLPKPNEPEYFFGVADEPTDPKSNPYHCLCLTGHGHAVRALDARARTAVSGSYDCTVRVWDVITGEQIRVLEGHSQKVYTVVLDENRKQVYSGSMDGTVRIWSLETGLCLHTLTGHTSIVGLLALSPSYLVSAAADSTLRVWNPSTGELKHTLAAHTDAITCFEHDDFSVISGSDGVLKVWNMEHGTVVRDLLSGITGVWQVIFAGNWVIAASNRHGSAMLDVWKFGKEVGNLDSADEFREDDEAWDEDSEENNEERG